MVFEREHVVAIVISIIAVLFVVGGFASFSGLATYSNTALTIHIEKERFASSDIFDAEIFVNSNTVLDDETVRLQLDGVSFQTINLLEYVSVRNLRHRVEERNGITFLQLDEPVRIHLADYVNLDAVARRKHTIGAKLGKAGTEVQARFTIDS